MSTATPALIERFFAKVNVTDSCWLWTASVCTPGYGQIKVGDKMKMAHRVSYEMAHGPIPVGLVIDHLCRVRRCVNPSHLEAVTDRENVSRGEGPQASALRTGTCQRGHEFTPENTYTAPGTGKRTCVPCHKDNRARRLRSRAA